MSKKRKKTTLEVSELAELPESADVDQKHELEIERSLSAIYQNKTGRMPDLTKFETQRSPWWLYSLIAAAVIIAALVGAAWAGFSFFKPYRGFSGNGLVIQIEGPERIALGKQTTYFINYQNTTAKPIAAADLRVSFPSDFVVAEAVPRPTGEGPVWRLGAMAAGARGALTVRGTFTGALGTATAIQVVGTYRPASFNSDFEALGTKVLNYTDSVLEGTLTVPIKVLPGDKVSFSFLIENTGETAFDNLLAQITLPEGFQRDPSAGGNLLDGRMARLPLGDLAAGASSTLIVTGTFASGVSGEAHIVAEAGQIAADGGFLPIQRVETSFMVLAGDLALSMFMNGSDKDAVVSYGNLLRFTLNYENTAPEDLKDIKLRLRLEPLATSTSKVPQPLADWSLQNAHASGTRKGDAVSWSRFDLPALARLPSREEGSIELALKALQPNSGTSSLAFRAVFEADVVTVGETKVNRTVRSAPIIVRYLTDAEFGAEARYYSEEGAPLGSGPLPPVAGQSTVYRVRWIVDKRFHELKDLKVSAALPKIAFWPGKTWAGAGEIAYDETARIVTWTLNRLPEGVKETIAEFDVQITPGEADANRFAQILGETRFEVTDANVKQSIARTRPPLTTDLQHDEYAQAKGVVRRAD